MGKRSMFWIYQAAMLNAFGQEDSNMRRTGNQARKQDYTSMTSFGFYQISHIINGHFIAALPDEFLLKVVFFLFSWTLSMWLNDSKKMLPNGLRRSSYTNER